MILLLLAGAASAGAALDNCQGNSPIAGTAGYRNAQHAISTNADTYGAVKYAESKLFPRVVNGAPKATFAGMQSSFVLGVTKVPTVESYSCPQSLSMRPLDLGAVALGVAWRGDKAGIFYSGSLAYSSTPFNDPRVRVMTTMGYYAYGTVGATVAPILPNYEQGVSTWTSDFILGGMGDLGIANVQGGYVGSKGLYGNITDPKVGFFGSILLNQAFKKLGYASGGVRRVKAPFGKTSAFARSQELGGEDRTSANTGAAVSDDSGTTFARWTTGTLEEADIFGMLDLRGSYAVQPEPLLHEVRVAFHTKGWGEGSEEHGGAYLAIGSTELPAQTYYGTQGGHFVTVEGMAASSMSSGSNGWMLLRYRIGLNDPDTLVLFPYAQNAWHFMLEIEGGG